MRWHILFPLFLLFLAACNSDSTAVIGQADIGQPTAFIPDPPATRPIGGIAPTFTPIRPVTPLPSRTPFATIEPLSKETAVPFDQILITLHYTLPALALDRSLTGNTAGQIIIRDETTGITGESIHREGIIKEMVDVLSQTTLNSPDEECPDCLFLSYELPLTGESGEGWLRDPRLAASLENYFAVAIGPHFPPETIVGLRRSASTYAPAHTLALTANGRLWRWVATEERVREDVGNSLIPAELQSALNRLPLAKLQESYAVDCTLSPNEMLYLQAGDTTRSIPILCPEFALPDMLIPLYAQLDELAAQTLGEAATPPPAIFPLTAVLDYKRADGAQMTVLMDGSIIVSEAISSTTAITSTISTAGWRTLQLDLLKTGELALGLQTFMIDPAEQPDTPQSHLLVRGEEGVYDALWETLPDAAPFTALDELLDNSLP